MLNKYFLSLRKQTIPTVCGVYATAFAAEAKANMRNVGKEEVDIETMIYNWDTLDGVVNKIPEGFLLSDLNKDGVPDSFEKIAKLRFWCKNYSLRVYNLQKISPDVDSLKRVIDNLAIPIVYIEFKMRRMEDFMNVYTSSTQDGLPKMGHVVAIKGYTNKYFILHDSNQGKENRIYFEDASIIKLAVTFNAGLWDKSVNHPLRKVYITQKFGENKEYYKQFGINSHDGTDYRASVGTDIYPSHSGFVKIIDSKDKAYGLHIKVRNDKYETIYAHLSKVLVNDGDLVNIDKPMALSGNTGNSSAPHLHFGLREIDSNKKIKNYNNGWYGYIDPMVIINS